MSAAEIADNQWELQSTKPPVATAGGLAQVVLMGGFALFFVYIIIASAIAAVSPKKEDSGLGATYQNLSAQGAQAEPGKAPAAAPAAEAPAAAAPAAEAPAAEAPPAE